MKGFKRYAALISGTVAALSILPVVATAQSRTQVADICSLINVLNKIAGYFAYAVGLVAVVMLLYSGFLFLIGGGNEETLKKAKTLLIFALVGVAIAMLAFSAVPIVRSIVPGADISQCG